MKIIVLLAVVFFKGTVLGVPLWFSISVVALLALGLTYWYRRLKARSEAQRADDLADAAGTHGDISADDDGTH